MLASMIYYCKFTKILTSIEFEINLYDMCVSNKVIDMSQMTICFHMDEYKLSHSERKANDCMIKCIFQEYESIFENGSGKMSVIRGKVCEYLGMILYYNVRVQVRITMLSYIDEILTTFNKSDTKGKGTN